MRCPFRIQEITMRQAHFLFPLGTAALLASFPMVHAQTINGQASFFHDTAWTAGALDQVNEGSKPPAGQRRQTPPDAPFD